ncbi:hypothetical protein GCM10010495_66150 [Kitasatospora herbaricolor]|uniref:hypothetical protein n=1 Tax=Kitasatospora herbaricolor TaxID=68217 RepID=UPI0017497FFA|nr:hypothetical protein [Kitasatospora herbaricolor]MDQ0307969.1 hypothetical protein [Kitasatospora herbaricolor]GGV39556.1 hypothetical protein GCM10010495_66150 [Kitasatospora herbaricolor]
MPQFTAHTLALIDDAYDKANASDGSSRFGSYLAVNAGRLHDAGAPLGPVDFAQAVWRIATSPVMSPGYVRIRPDLAALALVTTGEDYDRIALRIDVPLHHDVLTHRPAARSEDWQHDPWHISTDRWLRHVEPGLDRPALLLTATLFVPVPEHVLTAPSVARPGPAMTREAKQTVRNLVEHANAHARLVSGLVGGGR